jgi:hypothetical protein
MALGIDGDAGVDRGDERVVEHHVARRTAADRAVRLAAGPRDPVPRPHAVMTAEHFDNHQGFHCMASR